MANWDWVNVQSLFVLSLLKRKSSVVLITVGAKPVAWSFQLAKTDESVDVVPSQINVAMPITHTDLFHGASCG